MSHYWCHKGSIGSDDCGSPCISLYMLVFRSRHHGHISVDGIDCIKGKYGALFAYRAADARLSLLVKVNLIYFSMLKIVCQTLYKKIQCFILLYT